MRTLALLALLGACSIDGRVPGATCFEDDDCIRGEICARDGVCWPTADVRSVKTTWTLKGAAANEVTCAPHPDLFIRFEGAGEPLQYAPVPCEIGQHFMDKLPPEMTRVDLGDAVTGERTTAVIGDSFEVAIDLAF